MLPAKSQRLRQTIAVMMAARRRRQRLAGNSCRTAIGGARMQFSSWRKGRASGQKGGSKFIVMWPPLRHCAKLIGRLQRRRTSTAASADCTACTCSPTFRPSLSLSLAPLRDLPHTHCSLSLASARARHKKREDEVNERARCTNRPGRAAPDRDTHKHTAAAAAAYRQTRGL